jgi:hypothetical protein
MAAASPQEHRSIRASSSSFVLILLIGIIELHTVEAAGAPSAAVVGGGWDFSIQGRRAVLSTENFAAGEVVTALRTVTERGRPRQGWCR